MVHGEGILPFYSEVSAKTGMNIESIIELLVKEILHQQHRLLGSIWEPDMEPEVRHISITPSQSDHPRPFPLHASNKSKTCS